MKPQVRELLARFHASESEPDTERRKAIACQVYADALRAGLMTEYIAGVLGYTRSDTHGAQDGMRRFGGQPRKRYPSDGLARLGAVLLAALLSGNNPVRPGWGPPPPRYEVRAISPTVFPEYLPGVRAFGLDHCLVTGASVQTPPTMVRFKRGASVVDIAVVSAVPVGAGIAWDVSSTVGLGYGYAPGTISVQVWGGGVWSDPVQAVLP